MKNRWLETAVVYGLKNTLCTSEKQFVRTAKKLTKGKAPQTEWVKPTGGGARVHFFDDKQGSTVCVVCVNGKGRSVAEIAALLAHEAVHIKQETLLTMGEDKPSDEFEAYIVQNVTQNLMSEYARQKKLRWV